MIQTPGFDIRIYVQKSSKVTHVSPTSDEIPDTSIEHYILISACLWAEDELTHQVKNKTWDVNRYNKIENRGFTPPDSVCTQGKKDF
jgi:hypothetical protein